MRSPTLLMAARSESAFSSAREAEPVLVSRTSWEAVFVLDDGVELRFDAAELQKAIESPEPTVGAQARGSRVSTTTVRGLPKG